MTDGAERLSVLWVIKTLGYGGAEKLLAQLAESIDSRRFEITCVYIDPRYRELTPRFAEAGVSTRCLSDEAGRSGWIGGLFSEVRTGRYHIVHSHSPLPASITRCASRSMPKSRRPRVVTTEHSIRDKYHLVTRFATAVTSRWDDLCIAVSDGVLRSIRGDVRSRTALEHQFIDVEMLRRQADEATDFIPPLAATRVLVVANLREEKDFPNLFRACSTLVASGLELAVTVVGDSKPEVGATIRALAEDHGLGHVIRFMGPRQDVAALMRIHDILVISSSHEAGPVVAMEAAAVGIPIVSTRVGVLCELFTDNLNCILVDIGDSQSLAGAIRLVASDPSLRRRLVSEGLQLAARFDSTSAVRALETHYERLVVGEAR